MRIITGISKGVKLFTLDGLETRPTSERAKEAVFSYLQFELEGRKVLDLFCGSGQMALEALSRGASHAVMTDSSKAAVDIIKKNAVKTRLSDKCTVLCTDCFEYIRKNKGEKFDIIFADPPYSLKLIGRVLEALADADMLKPTSLVVCESGESDVLSKYQDLSKRYKCIKSVKYGIAYINIFTPVSKE